MAFSLQSRAIAQYNPWGRKRGLDTRRGFSIMNEPPKWALFTPRKTIFQSRLIYGFDFVYEYCYLLRSSLIHTHERERWRGLIKRLSENVIYFYFWWRRQWEEDRAMSRNEENESPSKPWMKLWVYNIPINYSIYLFISIPSSFRKISFSYDHLVTESFHIFSYIFSMSFLTHIRWQMSEHWGREWFT